MLKLMITFSILAITIPLPVNILTTNDTWEWFERMILSNKELAGFKSGIHVFLVVIFSGTTFWTLMSLKNEARSIYTKMQLERTKTKNTEWLKQRTIHVRGLVPHDKKGRIMQP
jgi:ABC-type microcin C transport system permease subunit YejB